MRLQADDPRSHRYVSYGLWPDCPQCQGMLARSYEYIPPAKGDFMSYYRLIIPCPRCLERDTQTLDELPWQSQKQNGAPYGTWPDCQECQGWGGRWYESSWDGHRAEMDFAPCQTCQKRTAEYHRSHPTELDVLLESQQVELQPLLVEQKDLQERVEQIEAQISAMTKAHKQALEPHAQQIRQSLQRVMS